MPKSTSVSEVRFPTPIDLWGGRHVQSVKVGSAGVKSISISEFGLVRIEHENKGVTHITPGGLACLETPAETKG